MTMPTSTAATSARCCSPSSTGRCPSSSSAATSTSRSRRSTRSSAASRRPTSRTRRASSQLLLNDALEGAALHVNDGAPPLSGTGLELLARKYMEVQAIITRWSRRYDDRLLEQLIYMPEVIAGELRSSRVAQGLDGRSQRAAQRARRRHAHLPRRDARCERRARGAHHRAQDRARHAELEVPAARVLRVRRVPADRRSGAHARRADRRGRLRHARQRACTRSAPSRRR